MARTTIPKTTLIGPYPTLPVAANSLDITFTASDLVNLNQIAFGTSNRMLVLVRNTHATNPFTVTFTSRAEAGSLNRTGDITTYTLQAGEVAHFVVQATGWKQADSFFYLQGSDVTIQFAAFDI